MSDEQEDPGGRVFLVGERLRCRVRQEHLPVGDKKPCEGSGLEDEDSELFVGATAYLLDQCAASRED